MSATPRQGLLSPVGGDDRLDLSQQLPGPFATLLLRTLGARVVKVEPPGGDAARRIDPEMFRRMAADKEIVTLDLKDDATGRRCTSWSPAPTLSSRASVPASPPRLAADWDTLRELNPRLVYCSLSGYGAEGRSPTAPAHDVNYLALAGGARRRGARRRRR